MAQCRDDRCGKPIFWITFPSTGKPHPVNCDVEGGLRPSAVAYDPKQASLFEGVPAEVPHDGRGLSHFADWVAAADFRRGVGR